MSCKNWEDWEDWEDYGYFFPVNLVSSVVFRVSPLSILSLTSFLRSSRFR